ncbi:MAG TPA: phosphate ABC transporter permease PstA [Nocardioidaceae bacterium]|nr:phosphate ABC transporter permease PstA [Nocardioidaceae bacterium]
MASLGSAARSGIRTGERRHDRTPASVVFLILLWLSLAFGLLVLLALLADTLVEGAGRLDANLFTQYNSSVREESTGARAGILGSLWLMGTTALLAVPLGVAAALYFEEFSDHTRWYNRLLEVNLQNLAAVPSVIYGLLAVAAMAVIGLPTNIVLGGAIALALLILPVIIITTREAVRAVPREIKEASMALGATAWQTTWRQTLPSAVPGIATGTIISMSRAIGEAAPLLMLGVPLGIYQDPDGILAVFTALPLLVYQWTANSQPEYQVAAAAAIVVLLAMVLLLNGLAIIIRNKFQRRW